MDFSVSTSLKDFGRVVKKLITIKDTNVDSKDKNNRTLLMTAVNAGITEFVKLVVNAGACVDLENEFLETPLFCAARLGHDSIVDFLIEANADLNITDKDGNTPLKIALDYGYTSIAVKLIKAGANPNRTNKFRLGPLYSAVQGNYFEIVKTLILSGADVNISDSGMNTPLFFAVRWGNLELVKLFLKSGANVNIANIKSRTPIFYAAENECSEIVEILVNAGANINLYDKGGNTPLHLAILTENTESMELLLEAGADVNAVKPTLSIQRAFTNINNLTLSKTFKIDSKKAELALSLSVALKTHYCSKALIKHIVLFSPETITPNFIKVGSFFSYWKSCEEEILNMHKITLCNSALTLLTFLRKKDRLALVSHVDYYNLNLSKILENNNYFKHFYIYRDLISKYMVTTETWFECFRVLRLIGKTRKLFLPNEVLLKIIELLPTSDLKNLSKSCGVLERISSLNIYLKE